MSDTARTRVFLEAPAEVGRTVRLPAEEAQHIFKVLRARPGETVELVGPDRRLFLAELQAARDAAAEVLEELPTAVEQPRITLYQAVPKGKHMDLVVEKATELGAERIVPLLTERGEVSPGGDKPARWRRLAESAARQSLQLRVPEIPDVVEFRIAAESLGEKNEPGVMLHNAPGLPVLESALADTEHGGSAALLVGPEGGWSEEELRLGTERGLRVAQMGPHRLRTETAGVVAVARAEALLRQRAGGSTGEERADERSGPSPHTAACKGANTS